VISWVLSCILQVTDILLNPPKVMEPEVLFRNNVIKLKNNIPYTHMVLLLRHPKNKVFDPLQGNYRGGVG
jgi:hypothetical protein